MSRREPLAQPDKSPLPGVAKHGDYQAGRMKAMDQVGKPWIKWETGPNQQRRRT